MTAMFPVWEDLIFVIRSVLMDSFREQEWLEEEFSV